MFLTDGRKSFHLTFLHQNYLLVHSTWAVQAASGHRTLNSDAQEDAAPAWKKSALCGINHGSGERAPVRFSLQCINKHRHDNENHIVPEVQCVLEMFNTAIT